MKMTKIVSVLTIAFAALMANVATAGDIYEFRRCNELGNTIDPASEPVLTSGKTGYFKLRLVKRNEGDEPFKMRYTGTGSETLDEIYKAPTIGILVNGVYTPAKYVTQNFLGADGPGKAIFTDLIFSYTVQAGDFAQPIVLCNANREPITDLNGSISYYLNFRDTSLGTPVWNVDTGTEGTAGWYEAGFSYADEDDLIARGPWTTPDPDGGDRWTDYDLAKADLQVKALDFAPADPAGAAEWRVVYQNGGVSNDVAAQVQVLGVPTTSTSFYLWSEDEDVFWVVRDRMGHESELMDITVGWNADTPITVKRHVLKIDTIPNRDGIEYPYVFELRGGAAGSGLATNLILSGFHDFNWKKQGVSAKVRANDFLPVKVRCCDPRPPSVTLEVTPSTAYAATLATYACDTWATKVKLEFTQAYDAEDVVVELKPSLFIKGAGTATRPWSDYIRFAEGEGVDVTLQTPDVIAHNPRLVVEKGHLKPTYLVTYPYGEGDKKKLQDDGIVYVYGLYADDESNGKRGQVQFAIDTANEGAKTAIDGWYKTAGLVLKAEAPVATMLPPVTSVEATRTEAKEFSITVADVYLNRDPDASGYELYYQTVSTGVDPTDAGWAQIPGDWRLSDLEGGVLKEKTSGKLPKVTYNLTGDYDTYFCVKGTNGLESAKLGADALKVKVTVKKANAVYAEIATSEEGPWTQSGTFDEGTTFYVRAHLDNKLESGKDVYVFLAPTDATACDFVDQAGNDVVTNVEGAVGVLIRGDSTASEDALRFRLADGVDPAKTIKLDVLLCETEEWDPAKRVPGFEQDRQISIKAKNKPPAFKQVLMGDNACVNRTGETMHDLYDDTWNVAVPLNVEKTFTFNVTEVDKDKKAEGDKAFKLKYTIREADRTYPPKTEIITGNPSTTNFTYAFETAGTATITLQMQDKDMVGSEQEWTDPFVFKVEVTAQAAVTLDVPATVEESDTGSYDTAPIDIGLSDGVTKPLKAMVAVVPNEKTVTDVRRLGFVRIGNCDTVEPTVRDIDEYIGSGSPINAECYEVTLDKTGKKGLWIASSDGTPLSNFKIYAFIVDESTDPEGQTWRRHYIYDFKSLTVKNVAPRLLNYEQYIGPAIEEGDCITNEVGKGVDFQFSYRVDDIDPDLTNNAPDSVGIKAVWSGMSGGIGTTTNICSRTNDYACTVRFAKSGLQRLRLTLSDKDGTPINQKSWWFLVESTKTLVTIPNGPTGKGDSALSLRYQQSARGRGEGHIWTEATFASADSWLMNWNCDPTLTSVKAYGYGYKTNAVDNGTLDSEGDIKHDIPISPMGNSTAPDATSFYEYVRDRNSYLYGWITYAASQGGAGGGQTTFTLSPETGAAVPKFVDLPAQGGTGGNNANASTATYPTTYLEAVFSLAYLPSDNLGDINRDGIPDAYLLQYDFGVFDRTPGAAGTMTGDDIESIADFNVDEDYLPSTGKSAYAPFIPGLPEDWAAEGRKFDAKLEIRGYDDNLNDAPAQVGLGSVTPERVYVWTDADGNKVYSPSNCTISELEFRAWVSAGCDPKWSPERPTDPTKEDTDKDGLSDGYEYYFWYRAFVGDIEYFNAPATKGKFRRLIGHRYNPLHPESGDVIGWEEIAKAFDPRSENPITPSEMAKRDLDNDGLPDLYEFLLGTNPIEWDTDGDGLPDGWEVMHGFDPLKEKTDDQNADGATNPDGDYMASAEVPLTVIESFDPEDKNDGRPIYYATTRALTGDDVEVKPVVDAKFWRVKIGGATYIVPDSDGKKEAFFTAFTNEVAAAEPSPAEGWYLAKELKETEAFAATALTEGDDTAFVRGAGARLARGVKLDGEPAYLGTEEAPGSYAVKTLKVTLAKTGSANDFTNRGFTVWRYGKGGRFALGKSAEVKEGTPVVGEFMSDRLVLLQHHQVYQWRGFYLNPTEAKKYGTLTLRKDMGTGFNPTTAWYRNKDTHCVNERWVGYSTADFEPMQDCSGIRDMAGFGSAAYPGHAVDTVPFSTGDEFLLMSFRYNAGHIAKGAMEPKANETMQAVWARETTLPVNGAEAFGADTDKDGVPDGWELYVATGPSVDDSSIGGTVRFSPLKGDDSTVVETDWVTKLAYTSQMTLAGKFAGTDTMIAYADVPSVADEKNLFNKRWLNKFWPLDPWSLDTDCDGIPDHQEGYGEEGKENAIVGYIYSGTEISVHSGIYGTPEDDGSKCIAGGGMNPNSWDTDLDGLPDLWEGQSDLSTPELVHHGWYMDGKFQGGMDPTVHDSYTRDDVRDEDGVVIDRDYDHDGLQNWQEYMTGAIRAFRYDDALSPWTVPQWSEATGSDEMFLEALVTGKRLDPLSEGGSNPHLVFGKFDYLAAYGSQCRRPSDYACGYWYFFPDGPNHVLRQGLASPGDGCPYAKEVKAAGQGSKVAQTYGPAMYFTCSPTCADSDADGMDDYYELFHGMDPLYGGENGRDLIALRWANGYPFNNVTAKNNLWTFTLKARGTSDDAKLYDFAVFPWMAGDPAADPDGDDIRNVDEAIQANAQANETWLHTDPTPLWMTDSSDPNSLVSRYYGGLASSADPDLKDQYAFAVPAQVGETDLPYVAPVAGHRWGVCNAWRVPKVEKRFGYSFVFEENDGYDTDHDGLSDAREAKALASAASDPQDSDDPVRRQAMYFPGARAALQAKSDAVLGLDGKSELFFLEFTVECWVKPEDISRAQTILERVIRHPNSNPGDWNLYRRNFQLGIDETGRFFAAYDSNGTGTDRVTGRASEPAAVNAWAHLAATYDGEALVLYVNGAPAFTQRDKTHPATSAETIVTTTQDGLTTDIGKLASESAIVMGASIAPAAPFFSLVPGKSAWTSYDRFYKGYLDEVRVWDGARDGDSIAGDYTARKRYTGADLLANREAVFAKWSTGARRNLADGVVSTAGLGTLPPELVYHYTFDGLFGAIEESLVAQEPNGFSAPISAHGKAFAARPANWVSPGWRDLSVHSLAYHNYAYVPWIPNLVAHLPPFDGTTLDSIYWSEDYAGAESALSLGYDKLGFPRTREPEVNFVPVQQALANFDPDATRRSVVGEDDKAFEFAKRARVLYATDLLPLGDAFVKYSTDFWDEAGASTVGDVNGKDVNFNNLPDWWEKLIAADGSGYTAEDGSSLAGVELTWNTLIAKDGVTRTAGEWYRFSLAAGAHDTKTGGVLQDPLYAQTADVDKDGMPDWWEDFAGLHDGKTDLTAGGHAWEDADNDGLANISEYAVSTGAVLGVAVELRPAGSSGRATDGYVIDYFRPTGDGRYLGEVQGIADHDMMEDGWEDLYDVTRANRWIWDALDDRDSDGWSNYAESRAGTDPTKVRHAGIEDTIIADYPVPMVHVQVRMPEATSGATSIVFQAFSGSTLGTSDATWTAGIGAGNTTKEKIIGTNPGGIRRYFLNPGSISPGTVHLVFNDQNALTEYYTVVEGKQQFTRSVLTGSGWYGVVDDRQRSGSTIGDLVKYDGSVVGWINYENGEMEVDYGCEALKEAAYVGTETSGAGENAAEVQTRTVCDLTRAYVKFAWQAALVKQGSVSEFYLTEADDGYIREGLNTFVAKTADGSLLGVARNVNVGWSKVEDLVIDLTETSPVFPRFEAGVTNGEPTTVRIVRKSINGVPSEKVVMRKRGVVGRHLFTEADFVKEGEFDLDWATLAPAAEEAGVLAWDFTEAEYEVVVNGERLDTFTKTFESVRTKPVAFSATADQDNLLLSVSPTFRWTGPAGYTAFRIQVATNEVFTEDTIVYDSDARFLPALKDGTYEFAADCYLNEHLADGQTYFWHVAMMNAKFADAEDGWSQAATFTVAADSTRLNTGYGKAAVDVRYYGSNACTRADVVVGLYRSADFTDAPVALQHLADGDLAELAVTNVRGCVGFTTNSVALFDGLKPGTYYAMAFIDANTNGVRDAWESWGYFNNVGTEKTDLYTPMTIEVVANRTLRGECVLFMEDTDVNKDGIPDCWQDLSGWSPVPPTVDDVDLDGDGMPDDWEDLMGDGAAGFPTDNAEADAAYAVAGDVMAYAEVDRVLVTFTNGVQALVRKDVLKRPRVGDRASDCNAGNYDGVYAYGDRIGLGRPTAVDGELRIAKVEDVKVALVHAQVYEEFEYDPTTANPTICEYAYDTNGVLVVSNSVFGANTKPFTALDKYLLVRYFAMLGYCDEATVNAAGDWANYSLKPGDLDNNRDGVADGWELYVMFGTGGVTGTLAEARVSPFDEIMGEKASDYVRDETKTPDGGELAIVDEWHFGYMPSDPWQMVTEQLELGGITDKEAFDFHLWTREDQLKDEDNDGLSNWAEYLATKAGYGTFDVEDAYSATGDVLDYFAKIGDGQFKGWYVGEALIADTAEETGWHMIADHDFVEDWWEDEHGANRYSYDAFLDEDQDGWDNWSTARASMSEDVIMEDKITKRRHTFIDLNAALYESIINNPETYEIIEDTINITADERGDVSTGKLVVNVKTVEKVPRAYPTPKVDLTLTFPRNFIASGVSNDVIASVCAYTTRRDVPDATWSVKLSNLEIENGIIRTQLRKADTGAGKLRQGLNTFVVTAEGGLYTGVARDVDVGWDLVTDVAIDLTTDSAAFPIFTVGGSNATDRVRVVRTAINGQEFRRTIWKSAKDVTGGTFTEIDLVNTRIGEFDFDWNMLLNDAAYCGIKPEEIRSVSYEIMSGTNVVGAYEKTFPVTRTRPNLVRPTTNDLAKVLAARPTFVWKGGDGVTAFVLQVSDDETFASDKTLVATNFLPATYADGRTYSPAWYVGEELENDKTYFWRVAELNAKWQTAEDGWSETASFTTAIDTTNANTGYGKVAADVRYYGPADAKLSDVVVAAYRTADFTGKPVARKRLEGSDSVSTLAKKVADADKEYLKAVTNVTLDGIAPGRYYVMAFIDSNTNGVRDAYETWGYVCKVGTTANDTWSPVALEVVSNKADVPAAVLIMEDTDVNRDLRPDCLEDMSGWTAEPEEPEPDFPEEGIDEDPEDGIPDDWEDVFGVVDPDAALPNQWMAYAETNVTFVKIGLTKESAAWYAVMDPTDGPRLTDGTVADGTDASVFTTLVTVWDMDEKTGVGTNVTFAAGSGAKVWESATGTASLIHAQVYAAFGYETGCAAGKDGPHTKAMTARDKYLVCRYLEQIGVADVSETNLILMAYAAADKDRRAVWLTWTLDPNKVSTDGDDVSDGWELYTMFGTDSLRAMFGGKGVVGFDAARISAWKFDGRQPAPAWDGFKAWDRISNVEKDAFLTIDQEFDDGYLPTDPWNRDTDGDGVIDLYAFQYALKGDDAGEDIDGDGLSNYAEYLVSEVFQLVKLDPRNPKTDGFCIDYFRRMGDLYLGEVFTDHDQVNDLWEEKYSTVANRYAYDPSLDADGDGWSNYEEYRAGTRPDGTLELGVDGRTKNEFPVPVIEAKVVYNGSDANLGSMVFTAWNEKDDPQMLSVPDATWTIANGSDAEGTDALAEYEKYLGLKPEGVQRYVLQGGQVAESSVKVCFLDTGYATCSFDREGNLVDVKPGRPEDAKWYYEIYDRGGKLVMTGNVLDDEEVEVGTIDYKTGLTTIDFSKMGGRMLGDANTNGTDVIVDNNATHPNRYDLINLDNAYALISWKAMNVGLSSAGRYYLTDADPVTATAKSHGHVRSGKNTFFCFNDADGDGAYTPGEPFGVVRGVDVGWQGAKFTVELTETHAVTPRIALWGDGTGTSFDDRSVTVDDVNAQLLNNVLNHVNETNIEDFINARIDTSRPPEAGKTAHIRVVRYAIDDLFCYTVGVGSEKDGFDQIVVMDKTFDPSGRKYLCEADFLADGQFDVDWGTLTGTDYRKGAIVNADGNVLGGNLGPAGAGLGVTNMSYLVIVGDGPKDFGYKYDTNSVRALATVVTRRFEKTRSRPVVDSTHKTFYCAHPTFTWSMPNEEAWAKEFGSSYTAFRLQILDDANPGVVVYDSDIVRAPKQDASGNFVWTAPVCAGSLTPQGKVFAANAKYKWHVTMYNAKFRSDYWSSATGMAKTYGEFSMAVGGQQDANDHNFSQIDVSVKYTGSSRVLAKVEDLADLKGKVRVQAFDTADFSGDALAEAVVTSEVSNVTNAMANAALLGLPVGGTYYVRAYIDLNGNCRKDAWESWGAARTSVVLSADDKKVQTVGLFIEDADTDQDWLPDAWEYAIAGWTGDFDAVKNLRNTNPTQGRVIAVTDTLAEALRQAEASPNKMIAAGISSGLPGVSLTTLECDNFIQSLLGLGETASIDDIRAKVEKKVAADSVKITSMTLAEDKVTMTVDADVAYEIAGMRLNLVYDLTEYANVTLRIWKKNTLLDANWTKVGEDISVTFEKGKELIEVPTSFSGEKIDFSSGFYKVEVVE